MAGNNHAVAGQIKRGEVQWAGTEHLVLFLIGTVKRAAHMCALLVEGDNILVGAHTAAARNAQLHQHVAHIRVGVVKFQRHPFF